MAAAVEQYCARVGIGRELAEPLFYSGWMHRAIREAVMLPPDRLAKGRYLGLLRRSIEGRNRPGLVRLLGRAPEGVAP